MNKVLAALLLTLACGNAFAQGSGSVPKGSVPIGLGPTALGWGSVAPGANGNCMQVTGGVWVSSPCPSPGGAVNLTGANGVVVSPNPITGTGQISLSQGAANTFKGSLNGSTTTDIALVSCSALYQFTQWVSGTGWQCGISPVLPSRQVALTLNLSAYKAITTQRYLTNSARGGATFRKVTTAIKSLTIAGGGSTCPNGNYYNVSFSGGSGTGAHGDVVVSGGVAISATVNGLLGGGNNYAVSDVLTMVQSSCVSSPTFTVASVGNAGFLDAAVTGNPSVTTAGSGCVPGTYNNVFPYGGQGDRLQGTVVISGGGTLTSFTLSGSGGGGYGVGDVVTFLNSGAGPTGHAIPGGCTVNPTLTIGSVASPLASFTDTAGNNWQIDKNGPVDVSTFGAVADYNSSNAYGDLGATDNGPAMRAALVFTFVGNGFTDALGYGGGRAFVPPGPYLVCNGLRVFDHSYLEGISSGGTLLKQCESDGNGTSLITLGNPDSHVGDFFAEIHSIALYGTSNPSGAAVIYSNNDQSGSAIRDVEIYGIQRPCHQYTIGYGGQASWGIHNVLCVTSGASQYGFSLSGNYEFSITGDTTIVGAGSAINQGIFVDGPGTVSIDGFHPETITDGVFVDGTTASPPLVRVVNGVGHVQVTNYIHIKTGSTAGNVGMVNYANNSTTCAVLFSTCLKTGNVPGAAGSSF